MPNWIKTTTCSIDGYNRIRFNTSSFSPFAFILNARGNHITLTFDGNGCNEGYTLPIRTLQNTEVTLPKCGFRKYGYTFMGWIVDGEAQLRAAGTPYIAPKTNKMIRAQWDTPTEKCTVTYKVGEGSGEDFVVQKIDVGAAYKLASFDSTGITPPTGKIFDRWEDNTTMIRYREGSSVVITGETSFTAIFKTDSPSGPWKDNDQGSGEIAYANGWIINGNQCNGNYYSLGTVWNIPKFVGDNQITNINTGNWGTTKNCAQYIGARGAISINNAEFQQNLSLLQVSFPLAEYLGANAFCSCKNLELAYLPECKTISNATFEECSLLTNITLSKVENIGYEAFAGCELLSNVSIPNCKTISDGAFINCKSLQTISLPATCSVLGNQAFMNCSKLTTAYMMYTSVYSSTFNAFDNCSLLTSIYVPGHLLQGYKESPNWTAVSSKFVGLAPVEGYTLTYDPGEGSGQIISKPSIPYGMETLKTFAETSWVAPSGKTFYKWAKNTISGSLYSEGAQFLMSSNTTVIATYSMASPWKDNDKDTWAEANAEGWYGNRYSVTSFSGTINPNSVYNIPKKVSTWEIDTIGGDAFSNKTFVSIGGKLISTVGNSAFYNCSDLTTVSFPACEFIAANAFRQCTNLKDVYLPLTKQVGQQAFMSCAALTTISLPNCWYIDNIAFKYCDSLREVYLLSTSVVTLANNQAFSSCANLTSIYVPGSLVDAYKSATNWLPYSNKIVAYNE